MQNLIEYKDKLKGEDVWIAGAGPSMNFINMDFFEDKITFAINSMFERIKANFTIMTDMDFIEDALNNDNTVIASKYDGANEHRGLNNSISENLIIFQHIKREGSKLELNGDFFYKCLNSIGKDDNIFVGCGTLVSSMHVAAYMGAKNIILCGNDCGYIDEIRYLKGYKEFVPGALNNALERFNIGGKIVKDKLKEVYGCNIYSLNPFINFGLEGHKYDTKK